jgi:DNA-binding response OmpR family regulator
MLSAIVTHHGFSVDTARDGAEAIDSIDRDGYDVVLLDLMMPRVDGYGVLHHMQEHHSDLLRCTIIASAVPFREIRYGAVSPVFRVHQKPFDLPQLMADVKECAEQTAA